MLIIYRLVRPRTLRFVQCWPQQYDLLPAESKPVTVKSGQSCYIITHCIQAWRLTPSAEVFNDRILPFF